ncbi:MAG: class I SAM-dependent methyltransferase [Oleiphilaceae bacterium]|nr:class I SAM-dependent methyltransferase [Oleiphilaceae bacterium]
MGELRGLDYSQRHATFERWFDTPLGQALLKDQRHCADERVARLKGARQLQIGISHRLPLATRGDFSQRIMTTASWSAGLPSGVVVCDSDELPFPSDSMDLVILHHSADFTAYPHQVLRESSRVLRSGGHMLILGFNPASLWGLRKLVSRHQEGPWGGRFLMPSRVEDWLSLLDFETESMDSHFFCPPIQSPALIDKLSNKEIPGLRFLPLGAYYCIVAKKRVFAPIGKIPARRRLNVVPLRTPGPVALGRDFAQVIKKARSGNRYDQ